MLEKYWGPDADEAVQGSRGHYGNSLKMPDRAEWLNLRPPFDPDSNAQERWSAAVMPVRAVCLAILWVTVNWWRSAIAVGTIVALVLIMTGHGQGGR